jgi:hypothetical protein
MADWPRRKPVHVGALPDMHDGRNPYTAKEDKVNDNERTIRVYLSDAPFMRRLVCSALQLYETVMEADEFTLDEYILRAAKDFNAVLTEGAEEVPTDGVVET